MTTSPNRCTCGVKVAYALSGTPSPTDVPAGCRFHPRCWMAEEVCRTVDPPLYAFSASQRAACHVTAAQEGLTSTKEGIREATSSG